MFKNIIGNEKAKQCLEQAINKDKISHSYLFIGINGIGKKLIAKEFAKIILCMRNQDNCNECKSCIEFDTNNNPDFMLLSPDGNSIKIEQIRDLQKKIQEKPIISKRKVYIIDEADKMTVEAQNCMLKTLEEPPQFATIILIGSSESAFLSTIKSRCMILHFEKIEDIQIKQFIQENYGITDINQNMLDIYQGSIGKAIELKDKKNQYEQIEKIIYGLENIDIIDILNMSEIIYKSKEEIYEILEYINIILIKLAKDKYLYTNCISVVEDTKKRLKQNANYDMSIDNMLFNMWKEIN